MFLAWEMDCDPSVVGFLPTAVIQDLQGDHTDFTDDNIYTAYETYRNPAGREPPGSPAPSYRFRLKGEKKQATFR